jgi:hypothetical protein
VGQTPILQLEGLKMPLCLILTTYPAYHKTLLSLKRAIQTSQPPGSYSQKIMKKNRNCYIYIVKYVAISSPPHQSIPLYCPVCGDIIATTQIINKKGLPDFTAS